MQLCNLESCVVGLVIRTLVKTERWARKTPVVREVVWCLLHDVADRTRARRGLCLGHVGVRCRCVGVAVETAAAGGRAAIADGGCPFGGRNGGQ